MAISSLGASSVAQTPFIQKMQPMNQLVRAAGDGDGDRDDGGSAPSVNESSESGRLLNIVA